MAIIDIDDPTDPNNVSELTPPGGNAADDYYVSGGETLIVNQNFSFRTLTLGSHSTGTKSIGILSCKAGFSLSANMPDNVSREQFSIRLFGLGEVKDDSATPTTRDAGTLVKCVTDFPHPIILLMESGAKWSVQFYTLIRPLPVFKVYEDTAPTFTLGYIPIGNKIDVLSFDEDEGGMRFELQDRYKKRPRFAHIGDEGRSVVMTVSFDIETEVEVGVWRQFKQLKEQNLLGCLITRRGVWPNMRAVSVGPITDKAEQASRASPAIRFQEDV